MFYPVKLWKLIGPFHLFDVKSKFGNLYIFVANSINCVVFLDLRGRIRTELSDFAANNMISN